MSRDSYMWLMEYAARDNCFLEIRVYEDGWLCWLFGRPALPLDGGRATRQTLDASLQYL